MWEKDRFKAIRKHFALTQEQFAKKINKTTSFVSTVETGRCGLSSSTFDTVCSVFGVNDEWLRTGSGEMLVSPMAAVDKSTIGNRMKDVRKYSIMGTTLGANMKKTAVLRAVSHNRVP